MDYGCVILNKLGRREMTNESEDDLAHKVLKDIKAPSDLGLLRCVQCGLLHIHYFPPDIHYDKCNNRSNSI